MTPFTTAPWAKLASAEDGRLQALPLLDHSFDVAAVFDALLRGQAWGHALRRTAGRALTEHDVARLVALAALHDIGKVNRGFQARWQKGVPWIGHEGEVAALLLLPEFRSTSASMALREIAKHWGAAPYFSALWAHHGRPREEFGPRRGGLDPWIKHRPHWLAKDGYDPPAEANRLIAAIRARYPLAWEPGEPLPDSNRFVAMFAGLLVLADWLGSDAKRFPVGGPHGAERERLRQREAGAAARGRGFMPLDTPGTDFTTTFDLERPRGVQAQAAADDLGTIALIEAETGSGKTEAALWRWLELRRRGVLDGLFFALPTRSAAVQLHTRVQRMLGRVFGEGAAQAVLAVPGYLRAGDAEGQALPGYEVRWDDGGDDARWAAERSNRYLAARVAVGTIDQALLGALKVKHAPFRAAMLARSLLVVDEVHASDAYMGGVLRALLANHVAAGGHALLLSATLGGAARAALLGQPVPSLAEAEAQPYPALSGNDAAPRPAPGDGTRAKTVRIEVMGLIDDADAIAARAVEAARAGASVLVVRNTVGGAVAVAQAVEALAPELTFQVNGVATLHHGRFAASDRRLLDGAVAAQFGKGRSAQGRILVGTQTLEQSLDIDADLLLTDLAPMDVLLQRVGRLHRHPREDRSAVAEARAIILVPAERDLSPLLERAHHGLGPTKDGRGAYPNVLQLEATLRQLEAHSTIELPADNRRLVERALHPEVIGALGNELGTAWRNHAHDRSGSAYADRQMATDLSLDYGIAFRELRFPELNEAVATRLGVKDLLVDFAEPLAGPFGTPVKRISIPYWMAGKVTPQAEPEVLDGQSFRLGERTFIYNRWGLAEA